MRDWLERMSWKIERFMQGRYGYDSLNAALCVLALVLLVVSIFVSARWMALTAYLPLGWALWRMYSKNTERCRAQNEAWLKLFAPVRKAWKRSRNRWKDRKTHRYFRCPKCRQTVRVPKGKGRIEITCPTCGEKFQKKT